MKIGRLAKHLHRGKTSRTRGFTLSELLVVLSIISILSVLAVPALSGLSASGNVNNAVNGISLLLDQSRAYAMAHNTYVWVGFAPNATPQQLTVGVVAGTTGQSTDIMMASTYSPIAKAQSYNYISLSSSISGLPNMNSNTTLVSDIGASTGFSFQQPSHGATVTYAVVLQFNPLGEASIGTTGSLPQWIQIGLQPKYGNNTNNPNVAAFQVATLTGQVLVFRK